MDHPCGRANGFRYWDENRGRRKNKAQNFTLLFYERQQLATCIDDLIFSGGFSGKIGSSGRHVRLSHRGQNVLPGHHVEEKKRLCDICHHVRCQSARGGEAALLRAVRLFCRERCGFAGSSGAEGLPRLILVFACRVRKKGDGLCRLPFSCGKKSPTTCRA